MDSGEYGFYYALQALSTQLRSDAAIEIRNRPAFRTQGKGTPIQAYP